MIIVSHHLSYCSGWLFELTTLGVRELVAGQCCVHTPWEPVTTPVTLYSRSPCQTPFSKKRGRSRDYKAVDCGCPVTNKNSVHTDSAYRDPVPTLVPEYKVGSVYLSVLGYQIWTLPYSLLTDYVFEEMTFSKFAACHDRTLLIRGIALKPSLASTHFVRKEDSFEGKDTSGYW